MSETGDVIISIIAFVVRVLIAYLTITIAINVIEMPWETLLLIILFAILMKKCAI